MMRRFFGGVTIALALIVVLAACGEDDAPPPADPPLLGGFESMAKQIATIVLTPTPTEVILGAEPAISIAQPTPTPGRPQPTPTMTPYVGIFLGDLNSEDGQPAPTLAPYVVNPFGASGLVSSGAASPSLGGSCGQPVAGSFATAYNNHPTVQQALGCPINGGASLQLVGQSFERGFMIWRDTRQIYALASNNQLWQMADGWNEGMPADDPAFSPPGGLLQPVRGFGLAWRSNAAVRDALGWGIQPEVPYSSFWQDFEGGAMFIGPNGSSYAIYPGQGQHSGPL